MKTRARVVLMVLAMLVPALERASAIDEATTRSVVAVRVVSDAGEVRGTAVLIGREGVQDGATLSFLTSARLFRGPDGDRQRISNTIELRLDGTRTLDVKPDDVSCAGNGFVDVAILRVTVTDIPSLRPSPLIYESPSVGAVFLLSGIDESGHARTVAEHVRFKSTLLVVGDQDASPLADCVGAPAIAPGGVFGMVRECKAHRPPVISLLSIAHVFLDRCVPRQTTEVTARGR